MSTYSSDDVRDLFAILKQSQSHSYEIGRSYFIRTVTMAYTGRVVGITDTDILLEDCAWVADTGKYHNFLVTGQAYAVEPYPADVQVLVNRFSVIDASPWKHNLFTEVV